MSGIPRNPPTSQAHNTRPPLAADADAFAAAFQKALGVEAKRERKPRVKTLIERTQKAAGRLACGVTYHPDGSRTVEIDKAEATGNGHDKEWDEVPNYGDR
jgi:hypothetical protein